jgi:hypothetical protein
MILGDYTPVLEAPRASEVGRYPVYGLTCRTLAFLKHARNSTMKIGCASIFMAVARHNNRGSNSRRLSRFCCSEIDG